MKFQRSVLSIPTKDHRQCRMVNLMLADFNVILIRDKNISERDSVQLTAVCAECDHSLVHLI